MDYSFQRNLLDWFYEHKRSMPWREESSPYKIWISEIMLQQTPVATVIPFFTRFMERFPSLEDLAKASEEEVLTLWAGLGYYSRARNILKTAQIIQSEENFPNTYETLLALPGVGPYTAGAVASMAFHLPVSLIDTNVDRVLGRAFTLNRHDVDFEKTLRAIAQELIEKIPSEDIWAWNQAIMELGALVCKANTVECSACPLKMSCKAFALGKSLEFPGEKTKSVAQYKKEYAIIVQKGDSYLFQKNDGAWRKGLYDFVIMDKESGQEYHSFNYSISNYKVTRIHCLQKDVNQLDIDVDKCVWLTLDEAMTNYPLVSPCKKFIKNNLEV